MDTTLKEKAAWGGAAVLDAALLHMLLLQPGWESIRVLTPAARDVIPVAAGSLVIALLAHLSWAVHQTRLSRISGELLMAAATLVLVVRAWQVFPFDLNSTWQQVVRSVLATTGVIATLTLAVWSVRLAQLTRTHTRKPRTQHQ